MAMAPSDKCIAMNFGTFSQDTFSYKWIIKDFTNCCKSVGEYIRSPEFSSGDNGEFTWQLDLYPCGDRQENANFLSLVLHSLNDFNVRITCQFSCINKSYGILKIDRSFNPEESYIHSQYYNRANVINQLNAVISDFILFFDINNIKTFSDFSTYISDNDKKNEMLMGISQLFNSDFYDVTINVNEKEFHAHKAILAARSPVFAAMFKHEMIEKKKNSVDVENIESYIFEEILRFIYTNEVEDIENIAQELMEAADKYALEGLKNLCIHKIYQTVNTDNAIELLIYANDHNADLLKTNITDFIVNNAKDVINKPEYQLLTEAPSKILMDLFSKLTLHKNN